MADFFADAGHAGDIVRAVAHHGFQIDQLARFDAILVAEGGFVKNHIVAAALGQLHAHMRSKQLQNIAIARGDMHIQALRDCLLAYGAQHIVRFHVGKRQLRDIEGGYQLAYALQLRAQIVGIFSRVALYSG